MKNQFGEEQLACALTRNETGATVREICRGMGVSEASFYKWNIKFEGMDVCEVRMLKVLAEEKRQLRSCWPIMPRISRYSRGSQKVLKPAPKRAVHIEPY